MKKRNSSTEEKKRKQINDILLIAAALLIAAIAISAYFLLRTHGREVVVTIDGREHARYSLAQDAEHKIVGENGESYNILQIRNGCAEVHSASCPDHICVEHAPISEVGQSIVCLPNRLIITIE